MLRALVLFLELPLYRRLRTAALEVKILRSLLSLKLEVGQVVVDQIDRDVVMLQKSGQVPRFTSSAGDPCKGDQANLAVLLFGGPDQLVGCCVVLAHSGSILPFLISILLPTQIREAIQPLIGDLISGQTQARLLPSLSGSLSQPTGCHTASLSSPLHFNPSSSSASPSSFWEKYTNTAHGKTA